MFEYLDYCQLRCCDNPTHFLKLLDSWKFFGRSPNSHGRTKGLAQEWTN
jgi:hypothetical protein